MNVYLVRVVRNGIRGRSSAYYGAYSNKARSVAKMVDLADKFLQEDGAESYGSGDVPSMDGDAEIVDTMSIDTELVSRTIEVMKIPLQIFALEELAEQAE